MTEYVKKTMIEVTMPDGSLWHVPAEPIAEDRASYYVNDRGDSKWRDEVDFALSTPSVLIDWAQNNMNWNDVVHAAKMMRPSRCDYQDGWVNGKKRVVCVSANKQ